jgi:hypothetical protein
MPHLLSVEYNFAIPTHNNFSVICLEVLWKLVYGSQPFNGPDP